MKYSVAKIGPLVYIAMCLLYIVRLDILFYNPLSLLFNLTALVIAIVALMVISERIDKTTSLQVLLINLLFSYAIAYCFNGVLFGTMDRISDGSQTDSMYRAFSTGFIIPMGVMLLFTCGNYADRVRKKGNKKANRPVKTKGRAISPIFEK